MTNEVYQWAEGVRAKYKRVDAQIVGETLEALRLDGDGFLGAAAIVEAARPKGSPIHSLFEWNNTKAAKAHREEEARLLVRTVVVVHIGPACIPHQGRAFVHVSVEDSGPYTAISVALRDPDMRAQVLKGALREIKAWRLRHAELIELIEIFSAIDATVEAVK